jgi:hypothetical protein
MRRCDAVALFCSGFRVYRHYSATVKHEPRLGDPRRRGKNQGLPARNEKVKKAGNERHLS